MVCKTDCYEFKANDVTSLSLEYDCQASNNIINVASWVNNKNNRKSFKITFNQSWLTYSVVENTAGDSISHKVTLSMGLNTTTSDRIAIGAFTQNDSGKVIGLVVRQKACDSTFIITPTGSTEYTISDPMCGGWNNSVMFINSRLGDTVLPFTASGVPSWIHDISIRPFTDAASTHMVNFSYSENNTNSRRSGSFKLTQEGTGKEITASVLNQEPYNPISGSVTVTYSRPYPTELLLNFDLTPTYWNLKEDFYVYIRGKDPNGVVGVAFVTIIRYNDKSTWKGQANPSSRAAAEYIYDAEIFLQGGLIIDGPYPSAYELGYPCLQGNLAVIYD